MCLLVLFFLGLKFQVLLGEILMWQYSAHIFMPLANLRVISLQGYFPTLKTRSCTDLYPLISISRCPLALGRGRIVIPGFIRFPLTLAVYEIAHSFPISMRTLSLKRVTLFLVYKTNIFIKLLKL